MRKAQTLSPGRAGLRVGLAVLLALPLLGSQCRLRLRNEPTEPKPVKYRTMEVFYEPPAPGCLVEWIGGMTLTIDVSLYVPGQLQPSFILACYPPSISDRCQVAMEKVGPNRYRAVFERVYVYRWPEDPKHEIHGGRGWDDARCSGAEGFTIPGAVHLEVVRKVDRGGTRYSLLRFHLSDEGE